MVTDWTSTICSSATCMWSLCHWLLLHQAMFYIHHNFVFDIDSMTEIAAYTEFRLKKSDIRRVAHALSFVDEMVLKNGTLKGDHIVQYLFSTRLYSFRIPSENWQHNSDEPPRSHVHAVLCGDTDGHRRQNFLLACPTRSRCLCTTGCQQPAAYTESWDTRSAFLTHSRKRNEPHSVQRI